MSSKDDRPRSLKYAEVREEREELLRTEPRVQELRQFVEEMRKEKEGFDIPHFDPLDGGVDARCLFLFEAAGGKTIRGGKTRGSGFASRNNDDASAQRFFELNDGVLDREKTVSWNIVPWALRRDNRNYPPSSEDIEEGKEWLATLLAKLRDLEVVVLCGNKAQRATGFLYENYPGLCVLHAPHPGPQSMLQPGKKEHLRAAIVKTATILRVPVGSRTPGCRTLYSENYNASQSHDGVWVNPEREGAEA